MKKIYTIPLIILVVLVGVYFVLIKKKPTQVTLVTSFETCEKAGYPVMESFPRQCKTPDGRTYAEEIPEKFTYSNASADLIVVDNPFPGAVTGKEFTVRGKARGNWYFEANFPIEVRDKDNKILFQSGVQAKGEWMTENFVPFSVVVKVPQSYIGKATVILKNDNPSGLPEHDRSISFPITIEY
jgi:hypothetical protein